MRTSLRGLAAVVGGRNDKTQQPEREPWETVGEQATAGQQDPRAETARRERAALPRAEIQGAERTLDLGRKKSLRTQGAWSYFSTSPPTIVHSEKLCSEQGILVLRRESCVHCV